MKLETSFTGRLAVLGVRGRSGHLLALDGTWELRPGAPVKHTTRVGDVELHTTVIGEITHLFTWEDRLFARGLGTTWLGDLLDEGSHALSMEMDNMRVERCDHPGNMNVISGRVAGALLVRADAFGWTGVRG